MTWTNRISKAKNAGKTRQTNTQTHNTMAKQSNNPANCIIRNVRLAFPHIFEKHASVVNGPAKYRAVFIIDPRTTQGKENLALIQQCREHCEKETFGRVITKYKEDRCCIVEGDTKTDKDGNVYDGFEDMMVLSCSSDDAPSVVDKDPNIALDKDDPYPYGGCYVDALIHFFCIKDPAKGGAGLFASMEVVQFRKHGQPFGKKKVNASEVMDTIEDEDDDDTPVKPPAKKRPQADDLDDDLDDL